MSVFSHVLKQQPGRAGPALSTERYWTIISIALGVAEDANCALLKLSLKFTIFYRLFFLSGPGRPSDDATRYYASVTVCVTNAY